MKFKKNILESMTNKLILTNVIIFVVVWILRIIFKEGIIPYVALQPISVMSGKSIWTIFTSMFVHFDLWHLIVNMISLFYVGNFVEKLIGKRRVLSLYILSGLFASVFWSGLSVLFGNGFFVRIFGDPMVFGIGASGALFGFIGMLAVLVPKTKIHMIAGPIIAIIIEYILMSVLPENSIILTVVNFIVMIYFFIAIFSMLDFRGRYTQIALPIKLNMGLLPVVAILPLIIIGIFLDLPIGNIAHLGGLILGLGYALILKQKYPKKTKLIAKQFQN